MRKRSSFWNENNAGTDCVPACLPLSLLAIFINAFLPSPTPSLSLFLCLLWRHPRFPFAGALSCSALHFFVCCIVPRRVLISASATVVRVASTHTFLPPCPPPPPSTRTILHRKMTASSPLLGLSLFQRFSFPHCYVLLSYLYPVTDTATLSWGASQVMEHTGRGAGQIPRWFIACSHWHRS